jgi:hypothetical protein
MTGDRFNTWQYQLTSPTGTFARIILGVSCIEFTSSASVFIYYNTNTSWFRDQIEDELKLSLHDLATPITPSRLRSLMQEQWALKFNPSFSYVPSVFISSIVRPYAQQQSLAQTIVEEVAQQLNISSAQASRYAKYAQDLVNLNYV